MSDVACQALPRLRFLIAPEAALLLRARERVRDYLLQHCAERPSSTTSCCASRKPAPTPSATAAPPTTSRSRSGSPAATLVALVKDNGRGFDLDAFDPRRAARPASDHGRGLFIIAQPDGRARAAPRRRARGPHGQEGRLVRTGAPLDSGLGADSAGAPAHRERDARVARGDRRGLLRPRLGVPRHPCQPAALRLTGKSLEHLRGHTPWELFPGLKDSALTAPTATP